MNASATPTAPRKQNAGSTGLGPKRTAITTNTAAVSSPATLLPATPLPATRCRPQRSAGASVRAAAVA